MAYEDIPRWHRSSPYVGAIGGLIAAVRVHLFGVPEADGLFGITLTGEIRALFAASVVLGYVVFVVFGTTLGWVFRTVERRLA